MRIDGARTDVDRRTRGTTAKPIRVEGGALYLSVTDQGTAYYRATDTGNMVALTADGERARYKRPPFLVAKSDDGSRIAYTTDPNDTLANEVCVAKLE